MSQQPPDLPTSIWRGIVGALFNEGRWHFPHFDIQHVPVPPDELLIELEEIRRQSWPGDAPSFDLKVAAWAAMTIFTAALLIAERHREVVILEHWLSAEMLPDLSDTSSAYSADLFLNLLPDLRLLAHQRAENDPLFEELDKLSNLAPFSDLQSAKAVESLAILKDGGFRTAFFERVLETESWEWLKISELQPLAKALVGGYSEYFKKITETLS